MSLNQLAATIHPRAGSAVAIRKEAPLEKEVEQLEIFIRATSDLMVPVNKLIIEADGRMQEVKRERDPERRANLERLANEDIERARSFLKGIRAGKVR